MATKHYENGIIGATEGGHTDISADIFVTGAVYWVSSTTGSDGNTGLNRKPGSALDKDEVYYLQARPYYLNKPLEAPL